MVPPPFRNHRLRPSAVRHGQAAFSLVELLVAVVLGSVVLGALGGALLVSEMRVSTSIRKDLEKKDALNRAMALMRQEISSAGKISINIRNRGSLCDRTGLNLWRASNTRSSPDTKICYKPLASDDTRITGAYPSDRPWTGPCVLVREGPPYTADGELDTASDPIVQVLVDNLVACGTMADAMDIKVTNVGPGPNYSISRDVDVTINQSGGIATSFSARIASNPLYAANDMYGDTLSACPSGNICYDGPNSKHFRPRLNTSGVTSDIVQGDPNKENVFYFKLGADAYTLRDPLGSNKPCSYEGCQVWLNGTFQYAHLENADVLVFADRDLRPGPRATGP
jgi:prepilin-type N-terminal cleavage/methylation domain-containing protein